MRMESEVLKDLIIVTRSVGRRKSRHRLIAVVDGFGSSVLTVVFSYPRIGGFMGRLLTLLLTSGSCEDQDREEGG
jgi:hypothetical protein